MERMANASESVEWDTFTTQVIIDIEAGGDAALNPSAAKHLVGAISSYFKKKRDAGVALTREFLFPSPRSTVTHICMYMF